MTRSIESDTLVDRVAVVTGAASGMGLAISSSSSAQSGAARLVPYVASKGGVNTIPPGLIGTAMLHRATFIIGQAIDVNGGLYL